MGIFVACLYTFPGISLLGTLAKLYLASTHVKLSSKVEAIPSLYLYSSKIIETVVTCPLQNGFCLP